MHPTASPIRSKRCIAIANMVVHLIMMSIQISITLTGLIFIFHAETSIAFLDFLLILWLFALIAMDFPDDYRFFQECERRECTAPTAERWASAMLTELQKGAQRFDLWANILSSSCLHSLSS